MEQHASFPNASARLREARRNAGLTLEIVGNKTGLSVNSYRDLEGHDGDLSSNVSLAHLSVICKIVSLTPQELLLGPNAPAITSEMSFNRLVEILNSRMITEGLSAESLGEKVGWEVKDLLIDPQELWNFTIDGVRDLCRFAEIPWTSIPPALEPGP